MSLRSVPKIACCRYFGTMTMWYRQYYRTWLWFCHSRIVVSPSWGLGGSTPGETTSPFTNQRRNGRAFSSLTARGGGLPIGVKVRRIGRQAEEPRAPRCQQLFHPGDLVGRQIIPPYDIPWVQGRTQDLAHPAVKNLPVDRPIDDPRGIEPVQAQGCNHTLIGPIIIGHMIHNLLPWH